MAILLKILHKYLQNKNQDSWPDGTVPHKREMKPDT